MNQAAWPGSAGSTPDTSPAPTSGGTMSTRESKQMATVKNRVLTLAGNLVAQPVTLAATSLAVTLARPEVDLAYGVLVTPNWSTTVWVTTKAVTGYTVHFGTAAPGGATADLFTFRSES